MSRTRLFLVFLLIISTSIAFYAIAQEKPQDKTKLESGFWNDVNGRLDKMTKDVKSRLRDLVEKEDQSFSDRTVQIESASRDPEKVYLISPANTFLRSSHWKGQFMWEAVGKADSYEIRVYDGTKLHFSKTNLRTTSYNSSSGGPNFKPDVMYSWEVIAHVGSATMSSSASSFDRSFFIIIGESDSKKFETALKEIKVFTSGNSKEDKVARLALTAVILDDAGLYLEASETLKEALRTDPMNKELSYMLAEEYKKMLREAECVKTLETILEK